MRREFRRYEPDQAFLLPPSLRDWLPESHLAFFLSDAIDAMDLSAFEARYGDEGPGKQAFDPRMMLKVLVYAYATGTFSTRKIAAKLHKMSPTACWEPTTCRPTARFRTFGSVTWPSSGTFSSRWCRRLRRWAS